jgi:hypothetical protein
MSTQYQGSSILDMDKIEKVLRQRGIFHERERVPGNVSKIT